MNYERLAGISVSEYEYPGEKNALALIKQVPMIEQISGAFLKFITQANELPVLHGDCFRITEKTAPEVYAIYKKALRRLDMPDEYPLFAQSCFDYNAFTGGGSSPFIVVYSSALKHFSEEELLYLLGHEIGHIKSKHDIYTQMFDTFNDFIASVKIPGVNIAATGLYYVLLQWKRMHEYTADRAAALAVGSIEGAQRGELMLMGLEENMNGVHITLEDILSQEASFEKGNKDLIGKVVSAYHTMNATHPWGVRRIQALEDWKNSGEFDRLVEKYGV